MVREQRLQDLRLTDQLIRAIIQGTPSKGSLSFTILPMLNSYQRSAITAEIREIFNLWSACPVGTPTCAAPAPLWAEDLWAAMDTSKLYETLRKFTELKARLNLG